MPGVYDEATLYSAAFDWPVDDEVDWLLALAPAASLLEPFCGQARFARAFAERGVRYIGVDRSPQMLALAPRGEGIELVRADVSDFDLGGRRVDLAWCPINSLCHLTDTLAISRHLACVHAHLAESGTYVVEIELLRHDGPWRQPVADRSTWSVPRDDGSEVQATVRRERCDLAARTCVETAHYRRVRDGAVVAESFERFDMRQWTYGDLVDLAGAAGFRVSRAFRNHGSRGRPEVEPGPHLENDGENYYFFLARETRH